MVGWILLSLRRYRKTGEVDKRRRRINRAVYDTEFESGSPWFKSTSLPLSEFVLGSPDFKDVRAKTVYSIDFFLNFYGEQIMIYLFQK